MEVHDSIVFYRPSEYCKRRHIFLHKKKIELM